MRCINKIAGLSAAIALLGLSLLMLVNVFARNIIRQSFIGTEALAVYLMIWITFIGAAVILPQYGHVSIDFFLRLVHKVRILRRLLGILIAICSTIVSWFFVWYGAQLSYQLFTRGGLVATLGISQGYIYAFITLATALMFCNSIRLLVGLLKGQEEYYPVANFTDEE